MHLLIQQKLADIRNIAATHKAQRLDLFGSATDALVDSPGDFDFLVEFEPLQPGEYTKCFFGLREALDQVTGRPVDLVVESAIRNPFFPYKRRSNPPIDLCALLTR